MPITMTVPLHSGRVLWPQYKPIEEVLALQNTTPPAIWECTYQGRPTPPGGSVFLRDWWRDTSARFDAGNDAVAAQYVARWISWDTALKDTESSAFTACIVGDLWADYRVVIREVWRDRLAFPNLPDTIAAFARKYNVDNKLRGIIIEDKASGTSAYQTLMATADDWIRPLLVAFQPMGDKETRAQQASVWCKNGSVLLPIANAAATWLIDFEDELFTFPSGTFKDQVDAFSQLIIYLEHILSEGYRARHA